MKLKFYLIVDEHGAVTARKNQPNPRIGQIAIPMLLQVPDTVFRPRIPQPIVIDVPESHVAQPSIETFEPPPEE